VTEVATLATVTIRDAAHILGVKPWDVVELIESGQLQRIELVDAKSLREYQEKTR
jgi:hypothetical protein